MPKSIGRLRGRPNGRQLAVILRARLDHNLLLRLPLSPLPPLQRRQRPTLRHVRQKLGDSPGQIVGRHHLIHEPAVQEPPPDDDFNLDDIPF